MPESTKEYRCGTCGSTDVRVEQSVALNDPADVEVTGYYCCRCEAERMVTETDNEDGGACRLGGNL